MACGVLHLDILAHLDRGRQPHGDSHQQPKTYLSDDLVFPLQAVLVVVFQFPVVVEEAYCSHPESGHKHEDHVDVGQIAEQQARHEDGKDDDHTSHCRGARFFHLPLQPEIPHHLAHLHPLQAVDYVASEYQGYQHREGEGGSGTERYVSHQMGSREVYPVDILKQRIYHYSQEWF